MSKLFFGSLDGRQLHPFNTIPEIDIVNSSVDPDENTMKFLNNESISFSLTFEEESVQNIMKHIVYGGDRGRYNGYVLRRDGYLSPDNAWMKG